MQGGPELILTAPDLSGQALKTCFHISSCLSKHLFAPMLGFNSQLLTLVWCPSCISLQSCPSFLPKSWPKGPCRPAFPVHVRHGSPWIAMAIRPSARCPWRTDGSCAAPPLPAPRCRWSAPRVVSCGGARPAPRGGLPAPPRCDPWRLGKGFSPGCLGHFHQENLKSWENGGDFRWMS